MDSKVLWDAAELQKAGVLIGLISLQMAVIAVETVMNKKLTDLPLRTEIAPELEPHHVKEV